MTVLQGVSHIFTPFIRTLKLFLFVGISTFACMAAGALIGPVSLGEELGSTVSVDYPATSSANFLGGAKSSFLRSDSFSRTSFSLSENDPVNARSDWVDQDLISVPSDGETDPLNVVSTDDHRPARPGIPINFQPSTGGPNAFLLSWDPPADDWESPISGHRIQGSTNTAASHDWSYIGNDAALSGPTSNVASATTAVPGRPTGLTVRALDRYRIELSWTAPSNNGGKPITGYFIRRKISGNNWVTVRYNTGSSVTTFVERGLQPGTSRTYRVHARNADGYGFPSNEASTTTPRTTVPSKPFGFAATALSPTEIKLSWNAPSDNGGEPITGYQLEVSTDGGGSWVILVNDVGIPNPLSYSDSGLKGGTTYHYRVRALNKVGQSPPSIVANATTSAATKPGGVGLITISGLSTTEIKLSWDAPSDNGGSPITGYRIDVSANGGSNWTTLTFVDPGPATYYNHTGLTAGTRRHYRVFAINTVGQSDPSNVVTAATKPNVPTGLTATALGPTSIKLSWTAPSNNGEEPISQYIIRFSSTGTGSWEIRATNSTATTYTDTGLTAGTTRYYQVRARNVSSLGDPSSTASATTPTATAPGAPTDLTATASSQTAINLSWTAPSDDGGSAITGYRIQVSTNGSTNWTNLVGNTNSTTTTYTHTGLAAGTTRHYRVRARNTVGWSDASIPANATTEAATTEPGAPTGLTASASGQTAINLSWSAPSNDGGSAITGYRIEVSPNGSTSWTNLVGNTNSTTTTYTHRNLTAGTTRHYRIRAINTAGPSDPSNIASATTDNTTQATAPDAPTGLRATASGQTAINLSWSAPSNNGGSAITGYRIQVSPNGSTSWINLVGNTNSTAVTYTHRNLTAGTTRHYRVRAINTVGPSDPSNVASATTDNTMQATAPDAPTGLTATASGQTTINLSWSAPSDNGGSAITGYRIQVSPSGGTNWTNLVGNTNSTTTTYTHTGLAPGTTRHYRVRAINTIGLSNPSNTADATTEAATTEPGIPTRLMATASGQTAIDLSWTAPSNNGGSEITGYRIEVSSDGMTNSWTELQGNTDGTATMYIDSGLEAGTTRYYRVRAINAVGESAPSNVANATTLHFTRSTENPTFTVNIATNGYVLPEASGGVPPYVYTLTPELSDGLTFDASTYTISGTPMMVMPAANYTYEVKDTYETTISLMFTIEIVKAVTFSGMLKDQSLARGQAMDPFMFPEASGGAAPIRYELLPDLPEGLVFDGNTRTLSGVPAMVTEQPVPFKFRATDVNGSSDSLMFTIEVFSPVSIERASLPESFTVQSNYPNPFATSTQLVLDLPWSAQVTVEVMDLAGRRVLSLPTEVVAAGWERSLSLNGHGLPSGMYMYRLIAASPEETFVHVGSLVRLR